MKYGIYYAYWEKEWGGEFIPYVKKCSGLGFDILEVATGAFWREDDAFFRELGQAAKDYGMRLTGGYGPRPEHNLASKDAAAVELAGTDRLGGALYSYWPVDFKAPIDKPGDTDRSIRRMQRLADMAADYGIALNMESLNRFEGYMINECYECVGYVKAVDKPNVKVMLDTFHMNIEEDSIPDAIRLAGSLLGHFHVGEANRRPPRPGTRMDWAEIGKALEQIHYRGDVVMEPFVTMGGQVGKDISIWRDLSHGATEAELDREAAQSVAYLRGLWG